MQSRHAHLDTLAIHAGQEADPTSGAVMTPIVLASTFAAIAGIATVCRAKNVMLVVDNTFATPMLQQPLALGAHVVVHSTTKYLNGHSDVVGGTIITSDDALAEKLRFLQNAIGAVQS